MLRKLKHIASTWHRQVIAYSEETPDAGEIRLGETVQTGYVDQSRDALDPTKTVWQEISGGNEMLYLGKREVNSRGYTSAFNFKGADQQKKVGVLSGGERNRVHLAKLLKAGSNVLAFEGDSHVEGFEGNFEAYEEDKKRRLGTDSTIPKRIQYKKFAR